MKIIDRNKDYYDYLSHVYGVDGNIAFDRRGSVLLTDRYIREFAAANAARYSLYFGFRSGSIENEPKILVKNRKFELNDLEIEKIKCFVKKHQEALLRLANGKMNKPEFWKTCGID
jgi:hypothetical protein